MKLNLTTLILLAFSQGAIAQALTEKTGLRLYEHHSSDMTGSPFGGAADGKQSGYDFVQGRYFNSINENEPSGEYLNGEEVNIDMVEHNGPFGTQGMSFYLGFTSGPSTIWGGIIKGNGTTRWFKAPATFDYAAADDVSDLIAAWKDADASVDVAEVRNNDVYIGKLRGGNEYVVIRCYNVDVPAGPPTGMNMDNISFDFDYKMAGTPTGIAEASNDVLAVYPNPVNNELNITLGEGKQAESVKIFSIIGEEVLSTNIVNNQVDLAALTPGLYILNVTTTTGDVLQKRIIRK